MLAAVFQLSADITKCNLVKRLRLLLEAGQLGWAGNIDNLNVSDPLVLQPMLPILCESFRVKTVNGVLLILLLKLQWIHRVYNRVNGSFNEVPEAMGNKNVYYLLRIFQNRKKKVINSPGTRPSFLKQSICLSLPHVIQGSNWTEYREILRVSSQ